MSQNWNNHSCIAFCALVRTIFMTDHTYYNKRKNTLAFLVVSEFSLKAASDIQVRIWSSDISILEYQKKNSKIHFWDDSEARRYGPIGITLVD